MSKDDLMELYQYRLVVYAVANENFFREYRYVFLDRLAQDEIEMDEFGHVTVSCFSRLKQIETNKEFKVKYVTRIRLSGQIVHEIMSCEPCEPY